MEVVLAISFGLVGAGLVVSLLVSRIDAAVYVENRWRKVKGESAIRRALRSVGGGDYGDHCGGWWGVIVRHDEIKVYARLLWWWRIPVWMFAITRTGRDLTRRWALEHITGVTK